jgi:ribosomal protein S20
MKNILLSALAASLLLSSGVYATQNTAPSSKEVSAKATQKATQKVDDKQVKLVEEALNSLKLSASALSKLNENKTEEAKKDIELALGKLESILAAKDTPKFLPIEQRVVVKNFLGSSKDVEKTLKSVQELLNDGKVQEAGELLSSLQSEIDVTVVSLPLITYPDALKLASKYIIENQPQKAKDVLKVALSTFSEVQEIIPIPLVNTLKLVEVASSTAKKDKKQALSYLSSANDELNKAQKLGYISKSTTTYQELHELIEGVEKEVKGPNKAEKLFLELGNKLKEFKEKIFSTEKKK